jgi:hypothetical protein
LPVGDFGLPIGEWQMSSAEIGNRHSEIENNSIVAILIGCPETWGAIAAST